MHTIKEVTALFKDREEKLPSITGKPSDDNLERIQEVIRNLLQDVKLPGGTDDSDLIIAEDDYKEDPYGSLFECLDTSLKAYDLKIAYDAMSTKHVQAEREWTANCSDNAPPPSPPNVVPVPSYSVLSRTCG